MDFGVETRIPEEHTMENITFGLGGQSGFQQGGTLNFSVELSASDISAKVQPPQVVVC